jgi:hypothetical protein
LKYFSENEIKGIVDNMVKRDDVYMYPTNFSAMTKKDLENLFRRGKQIASIYLMAYLGEILDQEKMKELLEYLKKNKAFPRVNLK